MKKRRDKLRETIFYLKKKTQISCNIVEVFKPNLRKFCLFLLQILATFYVSWQNVRFFLYRNWFILFPDNLLYNFYITDTFINVWVFLSPVLYCTLVEKKLCVNWCCEKLGSVSYNKQLCLGPKRCVNVSNCFKKSSLKLLWFFPLSFHSQTWL